MSEEGPTIQRLLRSDVRPAFGTLLAIVVFDMTTHTERGMLVGAGKDEGMLTAIQELRYEVYCLERHFIDPARFPDKREFDEYDPASVHIATIDKSGRMVGTLRLVLDSPLGFPLESNAGKLFPEFEALDRSKTAEISRLIVSRGDRRFGRTEALRRHHRVLLPLFRDMYRKSVSLNLEHWVVAMEPGLHRLLEGVLGLSFRPVGEPMDYYGEVIPYVAEIKEMERTLRQQRPALFAYFQDTPAPQASASELSTVSLAG